MKVLWFSNCVLGDTESKASGSWLFGMRDIISSSVELFNITKSDIKEISYNKYDDLEEYVLPNFKLKHGVPTPNNILKIKSIVDNINPDIIHIWGIENYWGLLFSRNYIRGNYIIEIQGLLSSCFNVYYGGLSPYEIIRCFNIKELIKFNSFLPFQRWNMFNKIRIENEVINYSYNISTQSEWIRNQIKYKTIKNVNIFNTYLPVRKEFYKCSKWKKIENRNTIVIFTSFSYIVPFKGFHILLKSLALLKKEFPNLILNVAGVNIKSIVFYRQDGYFKYLLSLIYNFNLIDNINFLGKLNATEISEQLLGADIFINSSFVESYSLSCAEALYLGVPSILSHAGAMPDFSKEKIVALYYSPLDYVDLASKIHKLVNDVDLSKSLSANSTFILSKLCDFQLIKNTQLSIYDQLLNRYVNP